MGDDRQGAHRLSRAVPAGERLRRAEADHRKLHRGCREGGRCPRNVREIIRGYALSAVRHYEFHNEGLADIPGYEYHGKLAQNIRKHGLDSFVNFLAELQVWGTPDQVFNKLAEHQRLADSGGLIGAFSYGGMPHEVAKRNMTLFAERVLPRLQRIEAACEIGSSRPLTAAAE